MLDVPSVDALTRRLMLGTAREPLPVERAFGGMIEPNDPNATLKALALLAQRSRFRRPQRSAVVSAEPLFPDGRRTIPEEARAIMISLFSKRDTVTADVVALAVVDAMARNQVRMHPFDLPRLEGFVKRYSEQLGPSALAWLERHLNKTNSDAHGYSFIETIDETNWKQGRPGQKAAFIWSLRAEDPAKARELVESIFPREQAPSRLALVKALANGLSPADVAFLESLATDRAQSVREAADALLDRLPGTAQATKRIQECLSRIKVTKSGLLRRRVALRIEFPATVQDDIHRWSWAATTFGTIPLDDFAKTLGLSVDDIATVVADDEILRRLLAVQAAWARRYDLLTRLVCQDPKSAWIAMSWADGPDISDPASAEAWSDAVVHPDLWSEMPEALSLMPLYQKLRRPLPAPVAMRLLASKAWRGFLDDTRERQPLSAADTIAPVAVLTPASLRAALRADLATLTLHLTAQALAILSLLDHIEAA